MVMRVSNKNYREFREERDRRRKERRAAAFKNFCYRWAEHILWVLRVK